MKIEKTKRRRGDLFSFSIVRLGGHTLDKIALFVRQYDLPWRLLFIVDPILTSVYTLMVGCSMSSRTP